MAHSSNTAKAHITANGGFDPVLSLPHVAALAGIFVATLKRIAERGEIKILKLSPRRLGVRSSECNRFIGSREVRA
jgi:hypothetical protein